MELDNSYIRFGVFLTVLLLMALVEFYRPARKLIQQRSVRWKANVGLAIINVLVLSVLGPITAVVVADYAMDNSVGLLSYLPFPLPLYVEITIGVVCLDMAIYAQHVASHKVPLLWRLHRVHHVDQDLDVTTALRFHPLEALLSTIYKCFIILLLGPVTLAVIIFEVILNASAMFNHANIRLPKAIENLLRKVIVTPDLHRVHHSTHQNETDSNYGFFISLWDRFFNTYLSQPAKGHQEMSVGINEYFTSRTGQLIWCLRLPFRKDE